MLRARLYEFEIQKRDKENQKELDTKNRYRMGSPNKILRSSTIPTSKRFKK